MDEDAGSRGVVVSCCSWMFTRRLLAKAPRSRASLARPLQIILALLREAYAGLSNGHNCAGIKMEHDT